VLTEGKWHEISASLEQFPLKSLRHLAQETWVSKSLAWTATKYLQLKPFKTIVLHELQPHDPTHRVNFCDCILQAVHDGDTDLHMIFFSERLVSLTQGGKFTEQKILEFTQSKTNTW